MATATKAALEELLRERRLAAEAPPLRGELRRAPLPTGVSAVDGLLAGGFPRGRIAEVCGPVSSGRTGLVLAAAARATQAGTLVAWVDPADRLDPASAAAAGVDLTRLLWLRGDPRGDAGLSDSLAALPALVGSGLFDLVVLDLASLPAAELKRVPAATWVRLQRTVAPTPVALVLLAESHTAHGSLPVTLTPAVARWSGQGPGRLLRGLHAGTRVGRDATRLARFDLTAL